MEKRDGGRLQRYCRNKQAYFLWQYHIDHVYNKLLKFTSIFYKIRDQVNMDVLRMIYFAFVHPHILYSIEIYSNTYQTHLSM